MKIIEWIKSNKLTTVLILILAYFLYSNYSYRFTNLGIGMGGYGGYDYYGEDGMMADEAMSFNKVTTGRLPIGGATPQLEVQDRMVVTNSYMSLLVTDVRESIAQIKEKALMVGGYMVNQSVQTPEGLSNGSVTVRVPSDKLDEVMEHLRQLSVRVVSENIDGYDVTDEYVDVEERLTILETTKTKYEAILNAATEVEDILLVTERIIYVQNQIDNLVGRQDYLEKTSSSSLITVYLSTDELELPFAPEEPWRPTVVFKYATRAVITSLRAIAGYVIWIAVYAVIWLPALAIFLFLKKKMNTKTKVNKPQVK